MAVNEEAADVLAGSPVFKELTQEALEAIAGAVQPQVVSGKKVLFREGDPGDCLYIIRSGSVRIFRRNEEGMHLDISIKGPGETFGEMALLTGEPRSADVETLGETHLMVLSKDQLDRIIGDFPDISKVFAREMRRWLFSDEKRLEVQAREVHKSLRITWFDYFLVVAVSVVLAAIFNYSNPNGIPLSPSSLRKRRPGDQSRRGPGRVAAQRNPLLDARAGELLSAASYPRGGQCPPGPFCISFI